MRSDEEITKLQEKHFSNCKGINHYCETDGVHYCYEKHRSLYPNHGKYCVGCGRDWEEIIGWKALQEKTKEEESK